jgi:predicted AAA+ superfamily ATPase
MKPWREVAHPHRDVLEGTFQQSEFAADITAVRKGEATKEYQDAKAFFERTFITEGMQLLLTSVARRLNGQGGDPVIQLQTAFGGGKTHTMLAVYHLATRSCSLNDLSGIQAVLKTGGIKDVPRAKIAVLDGTAMSPGQAWKHDGQMIHTLWGELAWQLGGSEAYLKVKEADCNGTSPGKEALQRLLAGCSPCVVLIDELVAYVRQFTDAQRISGGTYDSNLSFVQSLTEAAKLVPTAIILASLPESEVEAGSQHGVAALKALEKTFGRVQALWKPVATEEAFSIVRRRLFENITNDAARTEVCRAFAQTYAAEGAKLPSETHEARYLERMLHAYPIHPEVFDRLYEDWTTLDGFQRTRGVLKLMAKVIYRLWKDNNSDLMIMPGSLPLHDGNSRNELTYYLTPGWDAVIDKDIDGESAETTRLELSESRLGSLNAARRVARTLFLGSAPAAVSTTPRVRGLDRGRILLGCLQPTQTASIYFDAVTRLSDRLHYLNSSGDKSQESTRFWFDTRANLRREMEDRKARFADSNEVRGKIAETLRKLSSGGCGTEGVHIFTAHADIPDDSSLRLVFLPVDKYYSKADPRLAFDETLEILRNNGSKPRYKANRLLFVAADQGALARLRDSVRTALAWASIIDDIDKNRLNIDKAQADRAKNEMETAEAVLPRVARECFKWLLCPTMSQATDRQASVEVFPLNSSGTAYGAEVERVCRENELVITVWSPLHLRSKLIELYWKPERPGVRAMQFWEDSMKYLYLPRFQRLDVLSQAILKGASTKDFFGTAYAQAGNEYEGFRFGDSNIQVDDTLLLIEPEVAKRYEADLAARTAKAQATAPANPVVQKGPPGIQPSVAAGSAVAESLPPSGAGASKPKAFYGSAEITASTAKFKMVQIAEEIINILASDPKASVRINLEIHADYPSGASDQIKRAVSENANSLGFRTKTWES